MPRGRRLPRAGRSPLMTDDPLVLPPDEMAALRTAIEAAYGPDWRDKIAVPRPVGDPLTKDEVRQLLRECVTVVKPGEVLVIRMWETWTVQQMREMQDVLNSMHEHGMVPFRSLVVPGAELGVAEAPDAGIIP